MRIGIDARYVYADHVHGIGRFSRMLVEALANFDTRNEYVVLKRSDHPSRLVEAPNVREIAVPFSPVSPWTWIAVGPLARACRLDLFHSLFPVAPLFAAPKLVVTAHDLQAVRVPGFSGGRARALELLVRWFYRMAYPMSFRIADRVLAGSETTRAAVIQEYGLDPTKAEVIYEGIEARFFESEGRRAAERLSASGIAEPYLLNVGNYRPQKNVGLMLGAFAAYLSMCGGSDPKLLVVAGTKDRFFPAAEAEARALGIADRVRFLGYVEDERLPGLYRGATCYLTTSLWEGFGFTPLEAMASGTPVVASHQGALPEVMGGAAVLVDPFRPRDVAGALLRVSRDEGLRAELTLRGRARAAEFSWQETARRTLKVYADVSRTVA